MLSDKPFKAGAKGFFKLGRRCEVFSGYLFPHLAALHAEINIRIRENGIKLFIKKTVD